MRHPAGQSHFCICVCVCVWAIVCDKPEPLKGLDRVRSLRSAEQIEVKLWTTDRLEASASASWGCLRSSSEADA